LIICAAIRCSNGQSLYLIDLHQECGEGIDLSRLNDGEMVYALRWEQHESRVSRNRGASKF